LPALSRNPVALVEQLMRLAVISDIHGNLLALEAVIADIGKRAVDATVNLGDSASGPLWPSETVQSLEALALPTVRGNHDRWMWDSETDNLPEADRFARAALSIEQRRALHALPPTINMGEDILAVHGTPTDDCTFLIEETYLDRMIPAARDTIRDRLGAAMSRAVVLCGHSHRQSITQLPGGPLILNPGSVGCPVYADIPGASSLEPRSPHARYAILVRRGDRWAAEFHALDYDWDQAALRAKECGFPKWAEAFATGAVT
jgi:predicted phosphodiesterase